VLSSAKTEMLHCSGEPGNFKPSIYLSLHTFLTNDSKHKTYNNGDKLQPCFTEREIFTGWEIKLLTIIHEVKSWYQIFIHFINFGPKLNFSNTLNRNFWTILSKAFKIYKMDKNTFFS
jgi:hypothetical protein